MRVFDKIRVGKKGALYGYRSSLGRLVRLYCPYGDHPCGLNCPLVDEPVVNASGHVEIAICDGVTLATPDYDHLKEVE